MDVEWDAEGTDEDDKKTWNMSMELDDEPRKNREMAPIVGSLFHLPSSIRRIIQTTPLDCRALEAWFRDEGADYGHTLLHFFLKNRNVDGVRLMLDKGVSFDDPIELVISWQALFVKQHESLAILDLLIEKNAPIFMDTHVLRMKDIASRWQDMERVVEMADKMEKLLLQKIHETSQQLQVINLFPSVLNGLVVSYLFCY